MLEFFSGIFYSCRLEEVFSLYCFSASRFAGSPKYLTTIFASNSIIISLFFLGIGPTASIWNFKGSFLSYMMSLSRVRSTFLKQLLPQPIQRLERPSHHTEDILDHLKIPVTRIPVVSGHLSPYRIYSKSHYQLLF